MTFEEFKVFYNENKDKEEVISFVQGLNPLTLDRIKAFVAEDKDSKSWLDSEKDKYYQKAFKTFQDNGNLEKMINDEVKKRFPDKSEKDIELEKVKAELEKIKTDAFRKELANKAIKTLNEKKLPLDIVDLLVSQDEESTNKNIETLEQVFSTHIETLVNERLKTGYTPPKGDNKNVDISKMSMEEYAKYWKDQNK